MHKKIVSSSFWMFCGNIAQQVLQLLIFILLARQLAPDIFGQVALAGVAVDIATAIGGWGLVDFLMQRRRLSKELISHTHIFAVSFGLILALIVCVGTGIYVYFRGFTLVSQLVFLLAPVIILHTLMLVPEAIIRRNLDFKKLAIRNNLAAVFAGGTALVMAFNGFGVYALVGQKIVALLVLLIAVWIAAGSNIHLLKLSSHRKKMFFKVGENGFKVASQPLFFLLSSRIIDAIIGLYLGTTTLGQFKIATRIYEMIVSLAITPIDIVAFAALPKISHDRAAMRSMANHMMEVCFILFVPMLAGLAVTAAQWVPLVLGAEWLGIIPILQLFSLMSVGTIFLAFQTPIFLTLRMNNFLLKQSILRVLIVTAGCWIGAQWSLEVVLIIYMLQAYGFAFYNIYTLNRRSQWSVKDDIRIVFPALVASIVMVVVVEALKVSMPPLSPIISLALYVATGVAVYAGLHLLLFRKNSLRILNGARNILKKEVVPAPDVQQSPGF